VCPSNKIGAADLFLVSHHGASVSNSPALLAALRPRVAVMNNGARKGGDRATFERLRALARLEDLWQLHFSVPAGSANAPAPFMGHMEEQCLGFGIHVSARKDGSFRVINLRNRAARIYAAPEN